MNPKFPVACSVRNLAHRLPPALAGVLGLLAAFAALASEPWQTVDDFQLVPGLLSSGADMGLGPGGKVYSVGSGVTSPDGSTRTATVRVSTDHGTSWSTLPEFGDAKWVWAHYRGFASDANGRLYVCGNGRLSDRSSEDLGWIVRESDDGQHWVQIDDPFPFPGDTYAGCADIKVHPVTGDVYAAGSSRAQGLVIRRRAARATEFTTVYSGGAVAGSVAGSAWSISFHPDGRVFVAGMGPTATEYLWVALVSSTGEAGTWQASDVFKTTEWTQTAALACVISPSGAIHIAGWALDANADQRRMLVRSSYDGGATWRISDDFSLGGSSVEVSGIAMDSAGNVFVSGQAEDESGRFFWIVRQGTPQIHWIEQDGILVPVSTLTWSTSDQLQLAKFWPARANGITADAFGNVFVNGRAADAEGVDHFLVRRLSGVGPRFSVLRTSEELQLAWSADARHCILQSASPYLAARVGWT